MNRSELHIAYAAKGQTAFPGSMPFDRMAVFGSLTGEPSGAPGAVARVDA